MTAIRFLVFTDDSTRAEIACFGGMRPDWAAIISPLDDAAARASLIALAVPSCKALGCFFDRDGLASRSVQLAHARLLDERRITGLDAAHLKGLADWLERQGRTPGEPVASLFLAGIAAVSVSTREV